METYKLINRKDYIMEFIWNENYPIAIHVDDAVETPESMQMLANHFEVPVRDLINNISYYPQE